MFCSKKILNKANSFRFFTSKRRYSTGNKDTTTNYQAQAQTLPLDDYLNESIKKEKSNRLTQILAKRSNNSSDILLTSDQVQERLIEKIWEIVTQPGFIRKIFIFIHRKTFSLIAAKIYYLLILGILLM